MTKEEWLSKFIARLKKITVQFAKIDQDYEDWLKDEAEMAYETLSFTPYFDPEEAADNTLYAIKELS